MAVRGLLHFLSLFCAVFHVKLAAGGPILDSILNPLEDALGTIISGGGLVEGTLGAVQGILGVEQR
jgi:hypothetical protein